MRPRRLKRTESAAVYHLISRTVAGEHLLESGDQEVLRKQMRQVSEFCGIQVLTYCILSNHFHILVRVPPKGEEVSDTELARRYRVLYGADEAKVLGENLRSSPRAAEIRAGLVKRMHDISFFMKELKMRFTIYYNKTYSRFGTFWAERFKSLLVETRSGRAKRDAVSAVAAYIDLNAVRAGLAGDPKDYRFCGYAEAVAGSREARARLSWIFGGMAWADVFREYRMLLYGAAYLSDRLKEDGVHAEESPKVPASGGKLPLLELLRNRAKPFSDGLAIGSEAFVAKVREIVLGKPKRSFRPPATRTSDGRELCFARGRRLQ